ncbi:odorant receptor, family 60, subfamily A, member 1 [Misgurnus anguillicaudatus]|uniref:odorant receptor, family 60, subfamily A, member 1 n=1 Tax=Misgurnus anguillicaudatus TaxID=75329 RepID=UPI0024352712|nr:olfactory receptor 151 [Misgurnus anguillicaudatus]
MLLPSVNVTLILTSYGPPGALNYGVFMISLVVYLTTVFANITLMLVIYLDTTLHKPVYIFLFNLAINGLIGSSAVLPKIMSNLFADVKVLEYVECILQVFFVNVYGTCAYAILTVMAYDRYVAICSPLQYHNIMTTAKVKLLLLIVYCVPICSLAVQTYLTSRLPLCRHIINKLFCDNLAIVNLSCVKNTLGDIYGICLVFVFVVLPLIFVILSYVKIMCVSLKASESTQKKALKTCTPHLITFINFSSATLFSVIYNRLNFYLSKEVNVFISVHFILIPPLLHPLIYGIRTKEISNSLTKFLRRKIFAIDFNPWTEHKNCCNDSVFICSKKGLL